MDDTRDIMTNQSDTNSNTNSESENMNRIGNTPKKKAALILGISALVGVLASVLILALMHPGRVVTNKTATTNENFRTGEISADAPAWQIIRPAYEKLNQIAIRLDTRGDSCTNGTIRVQIYELPGQLELMNGSSIDVSSLTLDSAMAEGFYVSLADELTPVASVSIPMEEAENDNWTYLPINAGLSTSKMYLLSIETENGDPLPYAIYRPIALDRIDESITYCAYNGEVIPGGALALVFEYELPLSVLEILTYSAFIIFAAMLLGSALIFWRNKSAEHKIDK